MKCNSLVTSAFFSLFVVFIGNAYAEEPQTLTPELKTSISKVISELNACLLHPRAKGSVNGEQYVADLKKAGASFVPELLAPASDASKYTDKEAMRDMVGIYLFDLIYAMEFGKKKETIALANAVNTLLSNLGQNDSQLKAEFQLAMKQFKKDGTTKAINDIVEQLATRWASMITTEDDVELMLEATFAWMVEATYIVSEITAQQDYDPKFMQLLSEQRVTATQLVKIIDSFKGHPKYERFFESHWNLSIIKNIIVSFKDSKLTKEDVNIIRTIITDTRNKIIKDAKLDTKVAWHLAF